VAHAPRFRIRKRHLPLTWRIHGSRCGDKLAMPIKTQRVAPIAIAGNTQEVGATASTLTSVTTTAPGLATTDVFVPVTAAKTAPTKKSKLTPDIAALRVEHEAGGHVRIYSSTPLGPPFATLTLGKLKTKLDEKGNLPDVRLLAEPGARFEIKLAAVGEALPAKARHGLIIPPPLQRKFYADEGVIKKYNCYQDAFTDRSLAPVTGPLFSPGDTLALDEMRQRTLGNCWIIAAWRHTQLKNPELLKKTITDHGDGTYTVAMTFYDRYWLPVPSDYSPILWASPIRIDNHLIVNNGFHEYYPPRVFASQTDCTKTADGFSTTQPLWFPILTKAHMQLNKLVDFLEQTTLDGRLLIEQPINNITSAEVEDLMARGFRMNVGVRTEPATQGFHYHEYTLESIQGQLLRMWDPFGTPRPEYLAAIKPAFPDGKEGPQPDGSWALWLSTVNKLNVFGTPEQWRELFASPAYANRIDPKNHSLLKRM
jgi:hypothetical protein